MAATAAADEVAVSEEQIITFLSRVTEILNSEHDWNSEELQSKLEGRVDPWELKTSNTLPVVLSNKEVKSLLITKDVAKTLGVCVSSLVSVLSKHLHSNHYRKTMLCTSTLSSFLESCEKNNLNYGRACVVKLLMNLLHELGEVEKQGFDKGATYQLIAKVVGAFKKVKIAKSLVLTEISRKLKEYCGSLAKSSGSEFQRTVCCESLLLYLMILKELLRWNLEALVPAPSKMMKKDEHCMKNVKSNLGRIADKAPDYMAACCSECMNML